MLAELLIDPILPAAGQPAGPGGMPADPGRGSGLRGLADRVEALDGRLRVWTPPAGGTCVRAEIPVPVVRTA